MAINLFDLYLSSTYHVINLKRRSQLNEKIGFICGSLRTGSYNKVLLNEMIRLAPKDWDTSVISFKDLPLYNYDEEGESEADSVTLFRESIHNVDGIIIVSPEYNSGIPGPLKMLLIGHLEQNTKMINHR